MVIKKDVTQIHRAEHDSTSNARRVKMVDTVVSLKLDHNEDSVTSHPDKLIMSSMGVTKVDSEIIPAYPCSSLKRVQLYVETVSGMKDCDIKVQVSPLDEGNVWFDILHLTGKSKCSGIKDICARRIRVMQTKSNVKSELNVHLVGQG